MEMLIVISLVAVLAAASYPSVTAGLDALRMRSASDQVVKFLSAALDRADRRQQVVEVLISPAEGAMIARSADVQFTQTLLLPQPMRIASVQPVAINGDPSQPRRFLIYPGGAVPRIAVELVHPAGRRRVVSLDPLTGTARAEEVVR